MLEELGWWERVCLGQLRFAGARSFAAANMLGLNGC